MAFDLGAVDAMAFVLLSCAAVMCLRIVDVMCNGHRIVAVKFCVMDMLLSRLVVSSAMGITTFAISVMGLCLQPLQPLQSAEFREPMACRFGVVIVEVFAAQFGAAIEVVFVKYV
ncbi:hypothetical protein U1Q18_030127 [Sarracenia purpurea var. burkii]